MLLTTCLTVFGLEHRYIGYINCLPFKRVKVLYCSVSKEIGNIYRLKVVSQYRVFGGVPVQ